MKKAIFLDRDGTINSDEGHYYIYKVEDFVFNPGVIDGIRRLSRRYSICLPDPPAEILG